VVDSKDGKCQVPSDLTITNQKIAPVVTIVDVDCDGNATLQGNELGNGLTGYWKKASDSYAGHFADGSTETAATQYLGIPTGATVGLTWTLTNEVFDDEAEGGKFSCTADKTVYVTNGGFGVTAGPNDITDCSDTYQLQGSALSDGATGQWNCSVEGVEFSDIHDPNAIVSNLSNSQDNIFTWTVTRGSCTTSAEVIIRNNKPSVARINTADKQTICDNKITLTAEEPIYGTGAWSADASSIKWYDGNVLMASPNKSQITATSMRPNNDTKFTWTVSKPNAFSPEDAASKNCVSTASITVSNLYYEAEIFTAKEEGKDRQELSVCVDYASVEAKDAAIYGAKGWWTASDPNLNLDAISDKPEVTFTNLANTTTTFTWHVQNGTCDEKVATIDITNSNVKAEVMDSKVACAHNDELTATALNNGATGKWAQEKTTAEETTVTITSPDNYKTAISGMTSGSYKFSWTVTSQDGRCEDVAYVTITDNTFTVDADLSTNESYRYVCGTETDLEAQAPTGTGRWIVPAESGVEVSDINSNKVAVTKLASSATLVWEETRGECTVQDQITLTNRLPIVNAKTDYYTCDGTITLNATVEAPLTGRWEKISTSTPSVFEKNEGTAINEGIVKFVKMVDNSTEQLKWIVTDDLLKSCENTAIASVTNLKTTAEIFDVDDVCGSHVPMIMAQAIPDGYTGTWSSAEPKITFGDAHAISTSIDGLLEGQNEIVWTVVDNEGRCPDANVARRIVRNNNPSQATITSDASEEGRQYCGGKFTLKARTPILSNKEVGVWSVARGSVKWSQPVGENQTFDAAANEIICSGSNTTVQFEELGIDGAVFVWTIKNGNCTTKDEITIINNTVVADAGDNKESCDGTAILSALDPESVPYKGQGKWTAGNDDVVFENGATSLYNVKVSNLPAGPTTFYWTVSKGKCSEEKAVTVNNNSVSSTIEEGTELYICSKEQTLTGNNLTGTGANGIWVVGNPKTAKPIDGIYTNYNATFSGFSTGANDIKWVVNKGGVLNANKDGFTGGCTATSSINVVYNGISTSISGVDVNDNMVFTCETSRTFTGALPGLCHGEWTIIGGQGNVDDPAMLQNSTITVKNIATDSFTTLRWTVTSDKNEKCTDYAEVSIKSLNVSAELVSDPVIYSCTGTEEISAVAVSGADCWWSPANASNQGKMVNATMVDGDPLPRCYSAVTTVKGVGKDASERYIWHVEMTGGEGDKKVTCDATTSVLIANSDFELSAGVYPPTCNTEVTLDATHYESGEGFWELVAGNGKLLDDPTKFNGKVSIDAGATLTLNWHYTKNECEKVATVNIESRRVLALASDKNTCDEITTLTGTLRENETGVWLESNPNIKWLGENDVELTDPEEIAKAKTNPKARVKGLLPGNNPFTWTVSNGYCSTPVTANINYLVPNSDLANTYVPKWCADEYDLSAAMDPAKNNATGYWHTILGPGVIEDPTNWQTRVTGLQKGKNVIEWEVTATTADGGCTGRTAIEIWNQSPEISVSEYIHFCDDHGPLGAATPGVNTTGWWTMNKTTTYDGFALDGVPYEKVKNFETEWTNPIAEYTGARRGSTLLTWHVRDNVSGCEITKDVSVINGSFVASAGESKDIDPCEEEVGLFGTPLDAGDKGFWEPVDKNLNVTFSDPTNNRTTVTGLKFGHNILRWTITKDGCTAAATVDVLHMRYPGFTAGDDTDVCEPTYPLIGTDPKAFEDESNYPNIHSHWEYVSGKGTGTFDNSTNFSTRVRGLGVGENKIKWVVDNGVCHMEDIVTLTNYGREADAQGGKKPIDQCEDYRQFTAVMPSEYDSVYWRVENGLGDFYHQRTHNDKVYDIANGEVNPYTVNCDTATVFGLDYGLNTITWNVWNRGCHTTDTVRINNLSPSKAVVAAKNVPICSTEYHLSANSPRIGTGIWTSISENSNAVIANPTDSYTEVSKLAVGENKFVWTITHEENGMVCKTSADVILNNEAITVSAGRDFVVCEDSTMLRAADPAPYSGYWTPITSHAKVEDPSAYETKVTNLVTGANTFRWTKTNGACSVSDEVTITVNKPTTANAPDTIYSCTDYVQLSANTPDVDEVGWWRVVVGNGKIDGDSTVVNSKVVGLGAGSNVLLWHIRRGVEKDACTSIDTVIVMSNSLTMSVTSSQPEYCSSNGHVIGVVNVDEYTSEWIPVGGTAEFKDKYAAETDVTNLVEGMNTLRWTIRVKGPNNTTCESFKDVVVYNNTAPKALLPDSLKVCNTYADIVANMPPTGSRGEWGFTQGSAVFADKTANSTKVTELSEADNYITWTIYKGENCKSTATMVLTASTVATQTSGDNGTDTLRICGTRTMISAAPAGNGAKGEWTTSSKSIKFVDDDNISETTEIEGVTPGLHNLLWHVTTANGCEANAPLIVINDEYSAEASLATANPVCNGEATVIGNVPAAGAVGFWTGPSTVKFVDQNTGALVDTLYQTVGTAQVSVQGFNKLQWHIQKGKCETSAFVDVYNLTVEAVAGDPVIACNNNEVKTINAQPAPEDGEGFWDVVSGSVDIANKTSYITSVSGIQQGTNTLSWTIKSREWLGPDGKVHQCSSTDYLEVNNNYFTTNAGADREVCATETDLRATYHGSKAKGHWSGGHFDDPESYKTKVTDLQPSKMNTFTWTVELNGCEASSEVHITSTKVDIDITSGDKFICSNSTNIEARQSAGVGKWSIPTGSGEIENPTAQSTVVRNLNKNENVLRWTVTFGQQNCVSYKEVVIDNKTLDITAGFDQSICDTFATLAGMPLGENQVGTWYSGVRSNLIETVGDGPKFDDPHLYNTRVSGLYYSEDGTGYSNPFTWFVQDTVTQCTGEATVQIKSYHFNVDADVTTLDNEKVVEEPSIELRAKETKFYTGHWFRMTGNGSPTPADGFVTTVYGLSSGYNQIGFTAKLKESEEEDNYIPPCQATSYVTIAYRAFTVEAGADRSICEDSIQLNAQMVPNAISYWSVAGGGTGSNSQVGFEDKSSPKTWVRNLARGKNVLLWNVIKNGFLAQDSVIIYNYGFRVDAGEDQHLCVPKTELHATAPLENPLLTEDSYNWTGDWDIADGGLRFEDRFAASTAVDSLKPMTNKVVWHVTAFVKELFTEDKKQLRCYATDTVNVTYYVAPEPDFTIIPRTAAGCSPFEAQFANTTINTDTTGSVFYRWDFGTGVTFETTDHDSIVTPAKPFVNTKYYDSIVPIKLITGIKIPKGQTCYDTTEQSITVYALTRANFTATPQVQIQPSMNVNIYADTIVSKGVNYSWQFGDGSGAHWNSNAEALSTLVHTYDTWGEYTIQLVVSNPHFCNDTATQTIKIIPAPPTSIQQPTKYSGCAKYTMTLEEGVMYHDSVKWDIKLLVDSDSLKPEARFYVKAGVVRTYTFDTPGKYLLYLSAYGPGATGEKAMRVDTVLVYPTPVVNFDTYPDTVRLPNIPLYTQNYTDDSDGEYEWLWEFGDGGTSLDKEPTYYYTKSGDYYVSLTARNKESGCSDTKSNVHVRVEPEGMLKFPNAFTPDPSGPNGGIEDNRLHNDVFIPYPRHGVKAGTYLLEIFNRYGEKIYESTDVNVGWDGYYRGKLCPQDVYVYKCKCTFENGKIFKEIGDVTLLR
jgi:gliding motility-associated-like protein